MNSTYLGYILVILSSAAFASMSLFTKMAFGAGMSAWTVMLLQSVMGLVPLGFLLLREPRTPGRRLPWPSLLLFAACGASAATAFNLALYYLSISLGTILLFTYPAFVALGAWLLLGHRPSRMHIGALLLTLVGAVLTVNLKEAFSGQASMLGIGLALLAAVAHASYIVLGERLAANVSAVVSTTVTRAVILAFTFALHPTVLREVPSIPWQGWLICLVSTIVAGVAPFLFLNRGIALIGANRSAIASVAELPIALALGLIFQGDVILPLQWLGALLIAVAVIISQRQGESADGSGPSPVGGV